MTVRITQSMLFARALDDIRQSLAGTNRLQEQVATGRRVTRPSDDPAATLRIMPMRSEIKTLEQLVDNAALAREALNTGAASLEDASAVMQRLRELLTQGANGTLSESDRRGMAENVNQLLNQMLAIGNSQRGGRYLFGGARTDEQPFHLVEVDGRTTARYAGDRSNVVVEVAPGVKTAVNIPGDQIFLGRSRGDTVFEGTTGAVPVNASDSGVGFDTLAVTFTGLGPGTPAEITVGSGPTTAVGTLTYAFTAGPPSALSIDGGPPVVIPVTDQTFTTGDGRTITLSVSGVPATTTGTFVARAGLSLDGGQSVLDVDFSRTQVQVRDAVDGSVLNVDVSGLVRTGTERVTYTGTFDVFTVMVAVRDLLRNVDGLPRQEVSQRLSALLGEVDSAHEQVLDGLRNLGNRAEQLDLLGNRVEGLKVSTVESLSLAEDVDLAEAMLALNQQDIAYQASLAIGSRLVQTSLLNFLR